MLTLENLVGGMPISSSTGDISTASEKKFKSSLNVDNENVEDSSESSIDNANDNQADKAKS